MASNCININHPDVEKLSELINKPKAIVASKIAVWQNKIQNFAIFPKGIDLLNPLNLEGSDYNEGKRVLEKLKKLSPKADFQIFTRRDTPGYYITPTNIASEAKESYEGLEEYLQELDVEKNGSFTPEEYKESLKKITKEEIVEINKAIGIQLELFELEPLKQSIDNGDTKTTNCK
tara:strand:- start:155 stop:682 length:528 start_codon:yes stop_codon:yes gene_type:complete